MKFCFLPFFIILFFSHTLLAENSLSDSRNANSMHFVSMYEELEPAWMTIREPMPVRKCTPTKRGREQNCQIQIEYEDHPEKFTRLLQNTENTFDVQSPAFLSTDLGNHYIRLKKFMEVYNQFDSCLNPDSSSMEYILDKAKIAVSDTSLEAYNPECDCYEEENTLLKDFGVTHLLEAYDSIKEFSFENDLLLKSLEKSVQSMVHLESRKDPENFNNSSFARKLAQEFCQDKIEYTISTSRGSRKNTYTCSQQKLQALENLAEKFKQEIMAEKESDPSVEQNTLFSGAENQDRQYAQVIQTDINKSISELNEVLKYYNTKKNEITEQAQLELEELNSQTSHSRRRDRNTYHSNRKLKARLTDLKKNVFNSFQASLSETYKNDHGYMLQTPTIYQQSGLSQMDELAVKALGLGGVEDEVLTHENDFPLLQPISMPTAHTALQETKDRVKTSIQNLLARWAQKEYEDKKYLNNWEYAQDEESKEKIKSSYQSKKMERIENLFLTNPSIVGEILTNNPEYSEIICQVAQNISEDEEKKALFKKLYLPWPWGELLEFLFLLLL